MTGDDDPALDRAFTAFEPWSQRPAGERAAILERAADDADGPQFFLTTHSQDVLDALRGGQRFRVVQDESGSRFDRTQDLPLLRKIEEREHLDAAPTVAAFVSRGEIE